MREIKHGGVEKFVRNGKEVSQRKKKNLGVTVRNRFSATQDALTTSFSSVLFPTDLQHQRKEKEGTQDTINTINLNIYMYMAKYARLKCYHRQS